MTGPTWRCSDCDTYNDAGLRVCHLCEMPRGAAASRPVAEPPAKKPPVTSGTGGPARTRTGVAASGPTASALDWECPACAHYVVGRVSCDACGMVWTPDARTTVRGRPRSGSTLRTPPARSDALRFADPVHPRPTPREPTRGEVVAGCGCVLFLAAAVVTLIALLILNWSTVTSFLTGSDTSKSSATPSPTVSASGPCPKELAAMLPKGSAAGARLVAAYSRENVKDRYAFCRTAEGKVYYFFAKKAGASYGRPTAAEKSGTGYLVRFPDSAFRFRDLEVTAYDEDDKELWKEKLTPEAAIG
ncbi:hypothetical protein [Streptomyces viridochromogenes]|nr:hypothetical protein [Streptomyces viridochromogenes]